MKRRTAALIILAILSMSALLLLRQAAIPVPDVQQSTFAPNDVRPQPQPRTQPLTDPHQDSTTNTSAQLNDTRDWIRLGDLSDTRFVAGYPQLISNHFVAPSKLPALEETIEIQVTQGLKISAVVTMAHTSSNGSALGAEVLGAPDHTSVHIQFDNNGNVVNGLIIAPRSALSYAITPSRRELFESLLSNATPLNLTKKALSIGATVRRRRDGSPKISDTQQQPHRDCLQLVPALRASPNQCRAGKASRAPQTSYCSPSMVM